MKKRLFIVTFLVLVLFSVVGAQASPIAFKAGEWKMAIGDGKVVFEDGAAHVTDYKGYKLLQRGYHSNVGQFSLAGYTGLELEVKVVEEDTDFEVAIQLEDWAWNVVYKDELSPSDDWVKVEVDLSGLNLSAINALCIQASAGDFSVRNIQPTPVASASAGGSSSNVKMTGKAELNITAKKVDIYPNLDDIGNSVVGFNDNDWLIEDENEANGVLVFNGNHMKVTEYPGWKRVERKKGDDLSEYTGIQFEVKVEKSTQVQFIIQPEDWGWNQFAYDISSNDGWVTVVFDFEEKGLTADDMSKANAIVFQAGENFEVRNITVLPVEVLGQGTDFERDYGVELGLNYVINDDWEANFNATVGENYFKAGMAEVKGTPGDLNVRAFTNGTGANMGDPMNIIKGDKFYENKTAGIDFRMPVSIGSGHFFASTPVADPGKRGLLGGSFKATVADSAEIQLLGATEFLPDLKDADDNLIKRPYVIGSAFEAAAGGVSLSGEALTSGKKGLGLYGKVGWGNLEAAITHATKDLWTNRSDHDDGGYGTYHAKGDMDVLENLNVGLYFNQWYKLEKGEYKNFMLKPSLNWEINENAKLDAFFEYKKAYDFDKKKYNKLEDAKLVVRVEGDIVSDLNGKFISIVTNDGKKLFKVPAYVGRLSYTGLDKWTFTGEAGLSKSSATAKFTSNLHAKAEWAFDPNGTLEFATGRATLNDDEDEVSNASTAKHYYTVKFTYTF